MELQALLPLVMLNYYALNLLVDPMEKLSFGAATVATKYPHNCNIQQLESDLHHQVSTPFSDRKFCAYETVCLLLLGKLFFKLSLLFTDRPRSWKLGLTLHTPPNQPVIIRLSL